MIEELNSCPIRFTENAEKYLAEICAQEGESGYLFIGVKSGGCSGFSYELEHINTAELYKTYKLNGFSIAIDPLQLNHINQLEIDYENGLNNRGLIYNNPNASETCGCGQSFG